MKIKVVPAVHAEGGRLLDAPGDAPPRETLTALAREFGDVYVVDVEGVRRNKPDIELMREVTRNLPVWADVGPRYAADAMDALVAGASHLTLRWNTLRNRDELDELADVADPEAFHVMLEFSDKGFLPNASDRAATADAVARLVDESGFGLIVGSLDFDPSLARRLSSSERERWWYGHIDRDAVVELGRLGYTGVIVPALIARDVAPEEAPP